jgi:hypothetical protein
VHFWEKGIWIFAWRRRFDLVMGFTTRLAPIMTGAWISGVDLFGIYDS